MVKHSPILLVILVLLALVSTACQSIVAEPALAAGIEPSSGMKTIDTVTLHPFGELDAVIEGAKSTLTRMDDGVDLVIDTTGLAPNAAHTIWWVVFNNPEHCAAQPCAGPDIENPDVATMVGYATGAVTDENGNAHFVATLRVGDTSMAIDNTSGFPWQLIEPSPGLIDPYKAEIHAVPRTHGAVLDDPYAQLTTFTADCNPECANVQAAIHHGVER